MRGEWGVRRKAWEIGGAKRLGELREGSVKIEPAIVNEGGEGGELDAGDGRSVKQNV